MAARRFRPDGCSVRRRRSADHVESRLHLAEALERRAVPGSLFVSLSAIERALDRAKRLGGDGQTLPKSRERCFAGCRARRVSAVDGALLGRPRGPA